MTPLLFVVQVLGGAGVGAGVGFGAGAGVEVVEEEEPEELGVDDVDRVVEFDALELDVDVCEGVVAATMAAF